MKRRPDYFVAIRVDDPNVLESLERTQEGIAKDERSLERSLVSAKRSHINLFVLASPRDHEQELISMFQSVVAGRASDLKDAYIDIRGLTIKASYGGNFTVCAKAELTDPVRSAFDGLLADFAACLSKDDHVEYETENKDAISIRKTKWAVSLINTKIGGGRPRQPGRETIDKYNALEHGRQQIKSIQLLSFSRSTDYYKIVSEYRLVEEQPDRQEIPEQQGKQRQQQNRPKRVPPNMFVAMQVNDPAILAALRSAQQSVIDAAPVIDGVSVAHGALVDVKKAHITLNVFRAESEKDINRVSEAMKAAASIMGGIPFDLEFTGMGNFSNRVVFADLADDKRDRLNQLQLGVTEALQSLDGIGAVDGRPYNPHVTLFNMGKHKEKKHQGKRIDQSILEDGKSRHFGRQTFYKMEILSMDYFDEDGYYKRVAEDVPFAENIGEEMDAAESCHNTALSTPRAAKLKKRINEEEESGANAFSDERRGFGPASLGISFAVGVISGAMLTTAIFKRIRS